MEGYAFKPNLSEDMQAADLIISHCGAGTVLELLRLRKRVVCVVNPNLLDNHQVELAEALSVQNLMHVALSPSSLRSIMTDNVWHVLDKRSPADDTLLLREVGMLIDI